MKPRIGLVTSVVYFVEWFLLDQIAKASREFDVTVYVKTEDTELLRRRGIDAGIVSVPIERKIRPLTDLRALIQLWRAMRRERYVLIHSTGPKGGLLAMVAGWLARTPVRIHTFTGQVWTNSSGIARLVLKAADRITASLATHILIDSPSQRRFLIEEKVVSAGKSSVLANGSISGVDLERFAPNSEHRTRVRAQLGIPEGALVILHMARLTRDKGAIMMAEGFARLDRLRPGAAHLLVVGPDEENLMPLMQEICRGCIAHVHFHGYTNVPEHFMAASDVLCLPSYREGFGTVLIDAAATGIPAVASRIYGSEDAIVDGKTGLLHRAGDAQDLCAQLAALIDDPALRARLGASARERAEREFSEEVLTAAVLAFYREQMRRVNSG